MKKLLQLLNLVLLVLLCFEAHSQVKLENIISEKIYPDNTRTCYLEVGINAFFDKENLSKEIENHPKVIRFSFFDNTNLSNCMFKSDVSFTADSMVNLMNNIISKSNFKRRNFDRENSKKLNAQSDTLLLMSEGNDSNDYNNEVYTLTFPFDLGDKTVEDKIIEILKRKFISVTKKDNSIIIVSPVIISIENFETNVSEMVSRIQSSIKN